MPSRAQTRVRLQQYDDFVNAWDDFIVKTAPGSQSSLEDKERARRELVETRNRLPHPVVRLSLAAQEQHRPEAPRSALPRLLRRGSGS